MRCAAIVTLAMLMVSATAISDTACIVCTIGLGLVEQWLTVEPSSPVDLSALASPRAVCGGDALCESFLSAHGLTVAASVAAGDSPDETCKAIKLCTGTCTLFTTWPVTPQGPKPSPKPWTPPSSADVAHRVGQFAGLLARVSAAGASMNEPGTGLYTLGRSILSAVLAQPLPSAGRRLELDPCGLNVTCIIHRVFDNHLPLFDNDGDDFAGEGHNLFVDGLRGADWRGRDCNDSDATIYPGRKTTTHPADVDHNCNGIYGTDPATGKSYEELLCDGTQQRGLAIVGDSATAHFHVPPAWLRGKQWNLDDLASAAADELDWPQCSWSTGFRNTSDCPAASMPLDSVYTRLRRRNLCMHRDFQNIGVNGARTSSMAPPGVINGLKRDPVNDHPLLLFFALIGNDVCNGHPGTSHMTTPSEFHTNVLESLAYLDTTLPPGSDVIIIPLVDGRVLWDTMHDQIHPLGVPYPSVYEYLSCSGDNPCWGWLNTNATWRDTTSARAAALNAVYKTIVAHNASDFKNFNLYYNDVDWPTYIEEYVKTGGIATDLIEPVDGFHPSQSGNMYLAYNVWQYLLENATATLGPVNPNNAAITAKFGDQGGYGY